MTLTDFTKRMKKISTTTGARTPRTRQAKPVEIIDDVVSIGGDNAGWDKEERNGRMHLTRR